MLLNRNRTTTTKIDEAAIASAAAKTTTTSTITMTKMEVAVAAATTTMITTAANNIYVEKLRSKKRSPLRSKCKNQNLNNCVLKILNTIHTTKG